mmetsp:Transcript_57690/g.126301  ORF Transcript_57690/g.126301 Transcript_57690/m.126301 type:complete len:228 (+) Transcript_57690:278-961(+)
MVDRLTLLWNLSVRAEYLQRTTIFGSRNLVCQKSLTGGCCNLNFQRLRSFSGGSSSEKRMGPSCSTKKVMNSTESASGTPWTTEGSTACRKLQLRCIPKRSECWSRSCDRKMGVAESFGSFVPPTVGAVYAWATRTPQTFRVGAGGWRLAFPKRYYQPARLCLGKAGDAWTVPDGNGETTREARGTTPRSPRGDNTSPTLPYSYLSTQPCALSWLYGGSTSQMIGHQ